MRRSTYFRSALAGLLLLSAGWGGWACATNPATGKRQLSMISEQGEIQLGRDTDEEVIAAFGLYEDEALGRYVDGIGQRLAADSERPDLPWTFRVLDDPVVNAMALPGGFVYMTRGILAHMSSEAELAGVLGHEIGHVTARHAVNQMSKQQLIGGLFAVGVAVSPELGRFGGLAGQGLGLLFLKFSRDDERQADDLGLRYMVRAGYAPGEMPGMFEMLEQVSGLAEGGQAPSWLSTHPNPEARGRRSEAAVTALDPSQLGGSVGRQEYLQSLDGTIFGPDPRQGYFLDERFLHPELAFGLTFPSGWERVNQRSRVIAVGPQQDMVLGLSLAEEGSAERAARQFLSQEGLTGGQVWSRRVNSLPAAGGRFEASSGSQQLRGSVSFVELGGKLYRLLAYGLEEPFSREVKTIETAMKSFHRVTDRAVLAVEPDRLELVRAPRTMTLAEFDAAHPSTIDLDRLAVLNRVDPGEVLEAGTWIKRVAGVRPRPDERR